MENKNLLMLTFLVAIFLGLLYGGEALTGNFAKNAGGDAPLAYRVSSVLIISSIMAIIIFSMNKKAILQTYENKVLIFLWFAGITGFFLVMAVIFISMIFVQGDRQVIVYEPDKIVFWAEISLMIITLSITMWILYNYVSGRGSLVILRTIKQIAH